MYIQYILVLHLKTYIALFYISIFTSLIEKALRHC